MTLTDTAQRAATPQTRPRSGEAAIVGRILICVAVLLLAWGLAVATWGLPALYLPALAMVPVIFTGMVFFLWG